MCELAHESGEYNDSPDSYLCAGCHHLQYKCLHGKESIPFYPKEYILDNGKLLNFLQ